MESTNARIIFIGASKFGLDCLKIINESQLYNLVGVITAPETFKISYRPEGVKNVLYANIESYCDKSKIDCFKINQGMKDPALLEQVKNLAPDLFIVVGWYHMIPSSFMRIAPSYGLHASLLPDYSGGAPLVWAIINGEKKTGITLFQMAQGVDNGPIIGQLSTMISSEDTIASLYDRIESLGLKLLKEQLPRIIDGSTKLIIQDEKQRRVFPQRGPEDGEINWSLPAKKVYDFIRAQTKPYPGAFSLHRKDKVTIWASQIVESSISRSLGQAQIKTLNQRIFVGCGEGSSLEILQIAINEKDISVDKWFHEKIATGTIHEFSSN